MKWKCSGCYEMFEGKSGFVMNTSEVVAICFRCADKALKDPGVEIGPRVTTNSNETEEK